MLFLAQSDTTVGYLSRTKEEINRAKQRPLDQEVLLTLPDLKRLQDISRIPKKHRNRVRRARRSTFILPNAISFRVVPKESRHHALLHRYGPLYSSSANKTGERFNETESVKKADIIVKDSRGFFEDSASAIYKLSRTSIRRIR